MTERKNQSEQNTEELLAIEEGDVELLESWQSLFSERQLQEIKFARFYACDFSHGTTGHAQLLIIAKMSSLLNLAEENLVFERVVGSDETLQSVEIDAEAMKTKQLEELASLCHAQWSGWMSHLFSIGEPQKNGAWMMPKSFVERWQRQMKTPYSNLSDSEKESDRKEADKFIQIFAP